MSPRASKNSAAVARSPRRRSLEEALLSLTDFFGERRTKFVSELVWTAPVQGFACRRGGFSALFSRMRVFGRGDVVAARRRGRLRELVTLGVLSLLVGCESEPAEPMDGCEDRTLVKFSPPLEPGPGLELEVWGEDERKIRCLYPDDCEERDVFGWSSDSESPKKDLALLAWDGASRTVRVRVAQSGSPDFLFEETRETARRTASCVGFFSRDQEIAEVEFRVGTPTGGAGGDAGAGGAEP